MPKGKVGPDEDDRPTPVPRIRQEDGLAFAGKKKEREPSAATPAMTNAPGERSKIRTLAEREKVHVRLQRQRR